MITLNIEQMDIVYKALGYVCKNEGIEMHPELAALYNLACEDNPYNSDSVDCLDVMEMMVDSLRNDEMYVEYFRDEEE